jgi:anaerobic selenocysteine-containing dehydrogenase
MNQEPGTSKRIPAIQSSNIEVVVCMAPWWEAGAKFSDIVLPTRFLGERDDIIQWENYAVYMHTVCNPVPEAWNDLDIYIALANKLGFGQQLTNGQTPDQWLQQMYSAGNVPMSFADFQNVGFYKYPDPTQTPVVALTNFNKDPTNTGKLATPSGLVEIYSQTVATALGSNSPYALASYVPPAESYSNPLAKTYPIIMLTPHPKMGRHSQWQNLSWVRTNDQMFRNGYRTVYINSADASARGINDGDLVKVFNQRASLIGTATVSERVMPKTLYVWEGAWYQTQQPGNQNTPDIGGNVEALIDNRFGELTAGLIANALVDVQKWSGV